MKRIIALLLTGILCLPMAACRKAPESEQSWQETQTEATDIGGAEETRQQGDSSVHSGNAAEKAE